MANVINIVVFALKGKCGKYWPDGGKPMVLGNLILTLQSEKERAAYVTRDISVEDKKVSIFFITYCIYFKVLYREKILCLFYSTSQLIVRICIWCSRFCNDNIHNHVVYTSACGLLFPEDITCQVPSSQVLAYNYGDYLI